jgi:two-component system, NtrC family, sensor histidine kinase HydH
MKIDLKEQKSKIFFASPWVLTAAISLLTAIIVIFAVNNLKREKQLLHRGLFDKGQSLVRFIGAGTRMFFFTGHGDSSRVQHLIEQAADEPDIIYIMIVDKTGKIILHNNTEKREKLIDDTSILSSEIRKKPSFHIKESINGERIFEVIHPFNPFNRMGELRGGLRKGMGRGMGRRMCPPEQKRAGNSQQDKRVGPHPGFGHMQGDRGGPPHGFGPPEWCYLVEENSKPNSNVEYFVLIGLDISELEKLEKQGVLHVIYLSLALLLVGLGGWLSLLAIQNYRVSQDSLKHIQAFTGILISELPVGIIATDKNGLIKTCNLLAAQLIGVNANMVLGEKTSDGLPEQISSFFNIEGTEFSPLEREITFSPEGQGELQLSLKIHSMRIMDSQNIIAGEVIMISDLTKVKKLESQVHRHERLAALGKMAAGVAHELRNPLSSIKGFAVLLSGKFKEKSREHTTAQLLIQEVERLNRSITELLNFARPLPLKKEIVNIADLISGTVQLVVNDTLEQNIKINTRLSSDLPELQLDSDRFKQVFLNLYLNAIQSIEKNGVLNISAIINQDGTAVIIEIEDNGPGIEQEIIERVFEPYFTTKSEGVGLGLAIVYKIIDEHGGSIYIENNLHPGCKIIIELPVL